MKADDAKRPGSPWQNQFIESFNGKPTTRDSHTTYTLTGGRSAYVRVKHSFSIRKCEIDRCGGLASRQPAQGIDPSTDPWDVATKPAIASGSVTIFMWSTPGIVRISQAGDEVQVLGAAFIKVLSPPSPSEVTTDGLTALQKPAHSGSWHDPVRTATKSYA